jgi:UDP-glucose:glycoprotein glucosyltransferase
VSSNCYFDSDLLFRLPQVLLNGVALDENSLNGDEFEEAVLTELMRQTSALQKALFRGKTENFL